MYEIFVLEAVLDLIVRKSKDVFYLIGQHDHGILAGELARNWKGVIRPRFSTIYAIRYHDVGWVQFDNTVSWNDRTNQPYSFIDYPLEKKIRAYQQGITRVCHYDPYAGYLCSLHYISFFIKQKNRLAVQFVQNEQKRRRQLWSSFLPCYKTELTFNLQFLQFCDHLSLALCMNEPAQNQHPWFKHGIRFRGTTYRWIWKDESRISLYPSGFSGSFFVRLPYQVVDSQRRLIHSGVYEWKIE
jgi:hypothetical protein